ncbi:MAG: outer membrane protein assembly factor BamA [Deltaproteobacteria bacterium]|nr:outer membrane protein assembly factor BamA [Deltaproteobacteria bacterium]
MGRVRLSIFFAFLALSAAVTTALAQQPQVPIIVKELTVEGNRRVQEAIILGRIETKIGSIFNSGQLSEDLRNVFSLGFFDDVQLKIEDFEGGVKIVFVVVERPFIRDLEFTGNKKLSTSDLQEKIDLKLGSVYNPVEVQKARQKLVDAYEEDGYFEVQITPDVEKFADGDVKVVFSINEGRRISIERIVFKGNKGLTDRQLKGALATHEREYFILRGTLQRQKLDEDVERLLQIYNDHGFIQARVDSYDVSVDREKARVTLTFNVVEGPQYRIEDIKISGATLLPESEIRRVLTLKAGDVFSRAKLRESVRVIGDLYSNIGRASADINPKTEPTPATAKLVLYLDVVEGPEVYVERINISGNLRSQDKILRREIPMVEGDLFTLQKLNAARQRLVNLGYFDKVDASSAPGSDKSKVIVNIDVTERPTGIFSVGGGFSSADGLIGTVDLSQNNFLGRGWQASLRIRAGATSQQGTISFTEPWLFDRPLSAGTDIYSLKRIYSNYNYDAVGGGLRLSHPFWDYWRWQTGYRLTRDTISHLRVPGELSDALRDQEGSHITSAVTLGVVRDSRDNFAAPTRGGQFAISNDFAGVGGDSKFNKTSTSLTRFVPIWFDHILSGRIEGAYAFGWADEPLPLFERYYLGGPNTLRGFRFRTVSPVDETGTRVGGTSEILGNGAYIIPLPFGIRIAAFYDVGNVYGFTTKFDITSLRHSAGGGIRWMSPFGPLRLDYGVKLDRKPGEDFGAFQFSVGSPF